MGIGIKQPRIEVRYSVPGTKLLDDDLSLQHSNVHVEGLKRHPKYPDILLQPQPSDDVNDPLNWSRFKKELFYASLVFSTAGVGVVGPLFIPGFSIMAAEFNQTTTGIAQLNGVLVMFLGVTSFLSILLSRTLGKRPILLFTLLLEIAGLAWGANAKTYQSLYGARILQGLGIGAYACMGNALIADVFFLHEQGTRIALWQLSWVVAVNVTPLISARIISASGWRTAFYGILGYMCFCFIFVLLASPESTYLRSATAIAPSPVSISKENKEPSSSETVDIITTEQKASSQLTGSRFALWKPIAQEGSLLVTLTRPFVIVLTPSILWCAVAYSFLFSCNIISGAVYSQVFASPPYSLDTNTVGNISGIGPLLGSLVACLASGPLADYSARFLSRRNNGYFEPEMYLTLMIPSAVFSLIGFVGWGVSVDRVDSKIVPAAMIGLTNIGLTFGFCGTILYSSAVFPARQGDSFGIIMLCKSAFAFGSTYYVNDWLALKGPIAFFSTLGGLCFILSAFAIIFYVWGKMIRLWTSDSRLLGFTTR